ncbi:hypothetical protein [Methanomethylophilus alvi]|uniref:hypothetical protein n=1 Tax=Methanomethylophilus alvi TaxID=1291540 RepID=UPI0037DD7D9E
MTVLDEFFDSYLHYSVSQRLFEDRCRQLTECRGSVEERQALVDETLRLATCVSGNANDTESLIADTVEFIQNNGGDPDLLEAISLITNNLKEDRARADDYNISVSGLRIGNTARRPRRPQVANPFVYVAEEEPEDESREDSEEEDGAEDEVGDETESDTEDTDAETDTDDDPASDESGDGKPAEDGSGIDDDAEQSEDSESEDGNDPGDGEPKPKKRFWSRK